jgi:hypothetical protein
VHQICDSRTNRRRYHAEGEESPNADAVLSQALDRYPEEGENQGYDGKNSKDVGKTRLCRASLMFKVFCELPSLTRSLFETKSERGVDLVELVLDFTMELSDFEGFLPSPVVAMVILRVHELNEETSRAELEEFVAYLFERPD